MASYAAENYADLVTNTLNTFKRNEWSDIVLDLQKYVAMPYMLAKHRTTFKSGPKIEFRVRLFSNDAAENVKLNQENNYTSADVMKTGEVPWRTTHTFWTLEERLISMNRDPGQIVDMLKTSKHDAMTSLAEQCETNFFSAPPSSSDELAPFGLPYWIVKNNTEGFNGGAPSGFTTVGNLNPTTYARWKNWTAQYTTVSKTDFVRKVRTAMVKTKFRPPVPYSSSTNQRPSNEGTKLQNRFVLFAGYDLIRPLEELLEGQNDSLGNDVASKDGLVTIRRTPIEYASYIDENDTTDPIYGVCLDAFECVVLSGEYLRESKVRQHPTAHRTLIQDIDLTHNFCCKDRRQNFVIATNTGF